MNIKCKDRYQEALEYAKKTSNETLQKCLERLKQYEERSNGELFLYRDFAPLSFYFELLDKNGNRIMNGGLLYHGNPDQTYSVTFDASIGWQIHT